MTGPTYFGIAELARATGQRRQTVAQQYRRGSLPPPAAVLDMGPLWVSTGPGVEEWIHRRLAPAGLAERLNESGHAAP